MNLPGFTADMSIYKSKKSYSMRGLHGNPHQLQVKPAMYPGWEQMLPFIDPFWGWESGWTGDSNKKTFTCISPKCTYGGKIIAVCDEGQACDAGCNDDGFPFAECI